MDTRFSKDYVHKRILDRLSFSADEVDGDYLLNPAMKSDVIANAKKDASVLIGLVERADDVHVILTKRTETLNNHSGQVAFPGGKIDAEDASPEAAALREAWEEIGLDINEVEVLGRLPYYHTGSGYRVAPVVGFVRDGADFEINPHEVDYMFEVPLSFLMNAENHVITKRVWGDNERYFYEMPYGNHYIWGVTAGMLRVLHDRVFQ